MNINFKKLTHTAKIPTYGTEGSAGMDLYADYNPDVNDSDIKYFIGKGQTKMIHTGICMEIPEGYVGLIYARSSIATKQGLAPANKVGVVDSDYRGEILVPLHNHSDVDMGVARGARIAQIVIMPYEHVTMTCVKELNDTARGTDGFGSTGR